MLKWFGHMARMEEDWLVKRIVRCVRLRGRPQTGWMDGMKSVE